VDRELWVLEGVQPQSGCRSASWGRSINGPRPCACACTFYYILMYLFTLYSPSVPLVLAMSDML
jgi:hypothetical protein